MTLGDIILLIKSECRINQSDQDAYIAQQINLRYAMLCRQFYWNGLKSEQNTITTVASQALYYLPYIFDKMKDDAVRYNFISGTQGGTIIKKVNQPNSMQYKALDPTTTPLSWDVVGGTGSPLYSTGTVAINNGDTTVVGSSTAWTSAHLNLYIVFKGTSTATDLNDYGYLITAVTNGTHLEISPAYRGSALTTSQYEIRPSNNKRIEFNPVFTEGGKIIEYSYQRKPNKLYNFYDLLEVPELGEVLAYQVAASIARYQARDPLAAQFGDQAKGYLKNAIQINYP